MTESEITAHSKALADAMRIQNIIQSKESIHDYYRTSYERYQKWLSTCGEHGDAIELGSGMGPVKKYIPELLTTDVIAYPGLDKILDATDMDYADESLKFICMLNVFHHIPNVEKFLFEAQRCLKPGGKIHIIDQHSGYLGRFLFKNVHHENFEPEAPEWNFKSSDPLNDANGALAWIVFQRDRKKFEKKLPRLRIVEYRPHTPLFYWMSGGLKNWTLLSKKMLPTFKKFDAFLSKLSPGANCFVDIVVEKI